MTFPCSRNLDAIVPNESLQNSDKDACLKGNPPDKAKILKVEFFIKLGSARQRAKKSLRNSPNALRFGEIALYISLGKLLLYKSPYSASSKDLS
jgi:hypothetical protein